MTAAVLVLVVGATWLFGAEDPTRAATPTVGSQVVSGPARVIDGDTLEIAERRIRLFGVDAFERGQTCRRAGASWACGQAATEAVADLTRNREVTCVVRDVDRYRRLVARCSVDGRDLGGMLVDSGLALAYRRYSPLYVRQEEAARQAAVGAWAGTFEEPAARRRRS